MYVCWVNQHEVYGEEREYFLNMQKNRKLRTLLATHMFKIRKLTKFSWNDELTIRDYEEDENSATSELSISEDIRKLRKQRNDKKVVRDCIDRPNLHRLVELTLLHFDCFGSFKLFGEMPFERMHKDVKRFVTRSNNEGAHLYVSEQVQFRDWRGRLATIIACNESDSITDETALNASSYILTKGDGPRYEPEEIEPEVLTKLMGPGDCVRNLLIHHSTGVIGTKRERPDLTWKATDFTFEQSNGVTTRKKGSLGAYITAKFLRSRKGNQWPRTIKFGTTLMGSRTYHGNVFKIRRGACVNIHKGYGINFRDVHNAET